MDVGIDVRAREDVPAWLAYGTPVFTVAAALLVSAVALVALGKSPVDAYLVMIVETVTRPFGITETLKKAVPLVLTGLAVYLPLKAGLWNIGAEGQLILGGVAGTWIGINVSLPWFALLPLLFLGAAAVAACWAAVPAYLRARWDVNEIITTLLLTFVALNLKEFLIRGPMQGGTGTFPQTERLPDAALLPDLFGFGVHAGLLVAVLGVAFTWVLVNKTRHGFEITFVGSNTDAAVQAGMSKYKVFLLVFVIGGAFAGMAGISEIAGIQNRFRADFAPGYGFTAIVIALLGRNGALRVLLAGLFFALLIVGGTRMEVAMQIPAALTEVIQALVILFLITAEFFKRYEVGLSVEREPGGSPATVPGGDD
jgi:simple sugar transport system permease protein